MSQTMSDTVSHRTLDLLETRLRRIHYVVAGDNDEPVDLGADSRNHVAARLRTLERNLASLTSKSAIASQVLQLQQDHSSVFHPASIDGAVDDLPPAALASIVLAHTRSYELLHKQLSTLRNLSVPDPAALVLLVELQSKIEQTAAKQRSLALQVAKLRSRSALLLESWYTSGVLDMSEHWAGWEERLRNVEILVRREEAARKREDGFV